MVDTLQLCSTRTAMIQEKKEMGVVWYVCEKQKKMRRAGKVGDVDHNPLET